MYLKTYVYVIFSKTMQEPDESPSQKSTIIGMMCLCIALSLAGQFSQHWLEWEGAHTSLDTTYWDEGFEDFDGQMITQETFSESVNYWCPLLSEYDYEDWAVEMCDNLRTEKNAGSLASILLWISTATGTWFLVVAYRSIGGIKQNLSLAILDHRFCLATGGLMVSSSLIWRVMMNDLINDWERSLGSGFYLTLVGGLIGILAFAMILRLYPEMSEMLVREKSRIQQENEAKAKVEADGKAVAEAAAKDSELLQRTEEAVRAKREAEANPNDPLSWLRMAEAMDTANRHEEAERCRKTAMELMEKEPL